MEEKIINSLELYLQYPPGFVVETKCVEDVGCGMYPCYYLKYDGTVKVSTSVTSLISVAGNLDLNKNFKPPPFLKQNDHRIGNFVNRVFIKNNSKKNFYSTWETIDKRIKKLKPFEKVTLDTSKIMFNPDYSIGDKNVIIDKTIHHLTNFIHTIEKTYPMHQHIVLTGGKDSQLVILVPKLNSKNWSVFSSEPNYALVKRWLESNNIMINRLFLDDNRNDETSDDLKKKIICGDLYGNPCHIRWLLALKKIASAFNNNCIMWSGTAADAIYRFHKDFHGSSNEKYFIIHKTRVSTWQGNYHQVFKNFVGVPLLSPYHSLEIWRDFYQHLNPAVIKKDVDLRCAIGEKLFGKSIKWADSNPHPEPYAYNTPVDVYKIYLQYIKDLTAKAYL